MAFHAGSPTHRQGLDVVVINEPCTWSPFPDYSPHFRGLAKRSEITCLRQDKHDLKRIHIIGGKNHGKTTLVTELVHDLTERGYRVATIKHTHHQHELDTPGKDSYLHRQAGAKVVGIVARNLSAAYWPTPDRDLQFSDPYQQFTNLTANCDLILVEGDQQTEAAKIEVWRADVGPAPLAAADDSILAVVSDDPVPSTCHVYPRSDLSRLVSAIEDSLALMSDVKNGFLATYLQQRSPRSRARFA